MGVGRAAGGLLWRIEPSGARVALVHRPRRNDWSLPKGKLDEGESWEEAALREVEEETGCEARITAFAGATAYVAKRGPKLVLYWHMALVREGPLDAGDEIDEVAWLPPEEALGRLDYEADRRLLARAAPEGARPRPAARSAPEVDAERAALLRRVLALPSAADGAGLGPALELLERADGAAARGDARGARTLALAARRLSLLSAGERERAARARALHEEARHLAPWRRRAIRALVARDGASPEALLVAAELRDEEILGADRARPPRRRALAAATAVAAVGAAAFAGGAALHAPAAALLAGAGGGALAWAAVALLELWAARPRGG